MAAAGTTETMVFAQVFVTLLVIMDPVGNVPIFLAVTDRDGEEARCRRP